MTRSVKLLNSAEVSWQAWDWITALPRMSNNVYLCSKGFVNADLSVTFPGFADPWISFAQALGGSLRLEKISKHDYFPEDLNRVVSFEYAEEKGVIGYDAITQEAIATLLSPQITEDALDVALEYLELRLLSLLSKTFQIKGEDKFYFSDNEHTEEIEIISAVHLELSLANKKISIWFGLGKNLIEKISSFWLENYLPQFGVEIKKDDVLSLVLDQLAITPADLIDYTRVGSLIDLDRPFSNQAILKLNQKDFAEVELLVVETEIVCLIKKLLVFEDADKLIPSLTLELASFNKASINYLFNGAVLKLENFNPYFSFNSEKIADLEIAQIKDRLIVKVI